MPIDTILGAFTSNGPRSFTVLGATINIRVTSEETDDKYAIIEISVPAHFPGAPLHLHEYMTENFYILSGKLEIFVGDFWQTFESGDNVLIPPGKIHGYRNDSEESARFLVIAPGHDSFFFELMDWMSVEPVWPPKDRQALQDFGRRHDTIYV